MDNDLIMETGLEEPTAEQLAEAEAARKEQDEKLYGPARRAAAQRHTSADILAQHDNLIADMLYQMVTKEG